jgi:hypothetical protein
MSTIPPNLSTNHCTCIVYIHIFTEQKNYTNGIWCFSTKQTALRRKSKDLVAQNQDNVSDWGDMSLHRLGSNPWSTALEGKHANHYTTYAVHINLYILKLWKDGLVYGV